MIRHFGPNYFWVEPATSDWLKAVSNMSEEMRNTSAWFWYELSNRGAFMAPALASGIVQLKTPYYEGSVSVEAAGIIGCLHTFNLLAAHGQGKVFEWHFRWLRRFAIRHVEAIEILDACEC